MICKRNKEPPPVWLMHLHLLKVYILWTCLDKLWSCIFSPLASCVTGGQFRRMCVQVWEESYFGRFLLLHLITFKHPVCDILSVHHLMVKIFQNDPPPKFQVQSGCPTSERPNNWDFLRVIHVTCTRMCRCIIMRHCAMQPEGFRR